VAFKAEFGSAKDTSNELLRILEGHLSARFGSLQRSRSWFWGPRVLVLQVGQKSITVVWNRKRSKDGEWILLVGGSDMPRPLDRVRGREPANYAEEIILVSRGIHTLLAATPGITRIRWYFKGIIGPSGKAVWTPDELPWTEP
jgi:hypothetical protein